MKFLKLLDRLEEYLLAVMLPSMVVIVFLGTMGRYTGLLSWPWYEEAARYLMVWMVFLGAAVAAKQNSHFAVEILFLLTPARFHKYLRLIILIGVVFFTALVTGLAVKFVGRLQAMGQTSPALELPVWAIYSAIPVGLALMCLRAIQHYVHDVRTKAVWKPEGSDL